MDAMDYFSWMSPLAGRISSDIELTRCAYQDLWEGLSKAERDQVIDEAIIDPAVVLKYNASIQGGGKIKANSKFSWFTKSQLDLFSESAKEERSEPVRKKGPAPDPPGQNIPTVAQNVQTTVQNVQTTVQNVQPTVENVQTTGQNVPTTGQNVSAVGQTVPTAPTQPLRVIVPSPVQLASARSKRAIIASPPSEPNNLFGRLKNRQKSEDRQPLVPTETIVTLVRSKPADTAVLHPTAHPPARLAKPKTPPPPPPTTESVSLLSQDEVDSIPKTGFDFLDNW